MHKTPDSTDSGTEHPWNRHMKNFKEGIYKLKKLMFDGAEIKWSTKEYMEYYSSAYFVRQKMPPQELVAGKWNGFKEQHHMCLALLAEILRFIVIPCVERREFTYLLEALLEMWKRYKKVRYYLIGFLITTDDPRYNQDHAPYASGQNSLKEMSMKIICDSVFDPSWDKVVDAVIRMINQLQNEQELLPHDHQQLLKETIKFSMEIESLSKRPYHARLLQAMLANASSRYARLAREWLDSFCTFGDYLRKVERRLEEDKKLFRCYLDGNNVTESEKVGITELLDKNAMEIAYLIPSRGLGLIKLGRRRSI